jgi:hypothetical protein
VVACWVELRLALAACPAPVRYASSVKKIKTSASMNAEANAADMIAELRAEVVKLSTQLLAAQSASMGSGGFDGLGER